MVSDVNSVPENIHVVGAGRWARLIALVLNDFLPPATNLSLHSQSHVEVLEKWITERNINAKAVAGLPQATSRNPGAVIVANAAKDHVVVASKLLEQGFSVLVEKPFALSTHEAAQLINVAKDNNAKLASAHVMLFVSPIRRFARLIRALPDIEKLEIVWTDPKSEIRYNEQKSYDSSISVVADVFSHVYSIIETLFPNKSIVFRELKLARGGSENMLSLTIDDVQCEIKLARNSDARRRFLRVFSNQNECSLDFSTEPGKIRVNEKQYSGDPFWQYKPRPLTQQLASFLSWSNGGKEDANLSVEVGYRACELTDEILQTYYRHQKAWTCSNLDSNKSTSSDPDLVYALTEMFRSFSLSKTIPGTEALELLAQRLRSEKP